MALLLSLLILQPARGGQETATPPVSIPAFRQAQRIALIPIRGTIDALTYRSLERRFIQAREDGIDALVLDIDTPGGALDATLNICNLLKDRQYTPVNTVAWIHPQAYSAGTIIALACREILVTPNGTFGDAAPIQAMPVAGLIEMSPTERAKVEAPLLSEVVDSARRARYDENLVQAFVAVGMEIWMIEHEQTGVRAFVDRVEYVILFGEEPLESLASVTPPPEAGSGIRPRINDAIPLSSFRSSSSLDDQEQSLEASYREHLPSLRTSFTREDGRDWRPVMQVISADRLLTLKAAEAVHYGLARGIVRDETELRNWFGAQSIVVLDESWSEGLVRLLVSLPVRIILIVLFIIGLFIEIAAPGTSVFGSVALAAFLVLVGAPFLTGMAQWWEILLVLFGILLLVIEVIFLPGLGLVGIAGCGCLMVGIIGTFISGDLASPQGQVELRHGLFAVCTAMFAAFAGTWILSRWLNTPLFFDRFILTEMTHSSAQQHGSPAVGSTAAGSPAPAMGTLGTALTDLKPAGRADFDGTWIHVQTQGQFCAKGTPVRIISTEGITITVEETDQ